MVALGFAPIAGVAENDQNDVFRGTELAQREGDDEDVETNRLEVKAPSSEPRRPYGGRHPSQTPHHERHDFMSPNHITRSVHDLTIAAWFGGSLMGSIGLNGATAQASDSTERLHLASVGWKRWAPVQFTAVIGHLVSDVGVLVQNKGRVATQNGVKELTVVNAIFTIAASGATLYSAILGSKVDKHSDEGGTGATEAAPGASDELKSAAAQLRVVQWSIPILTGVVLVLNAAHGELQRPAAVAKGILKR